jgi:hypothetical protein
VLNVLSALNVLSVLHFAKLLQTWTLAQTAHPFTAVVLVVQIETLESSRSGVHHWAGRRLDVRWKTTFGSQLVLAAPGEIICVAVAFRQMGLAWILLGEFDDVSMTGAVSWRAVLMLSLLD